MNWETKVLFLTFFWTRQTKNKNPLTSYSTVFVNRMVFLQIMVVVHSLLNAIGLSGNLLVIATVVLEKKLHAMRYIYLASLAVSDALCLILVNSQLSPNNKYSNRKMAVWRDSVLSQSLLWEMLISKYTSSSNSCILWAIQGHCQISFDIQW